MLNIIDKEIKNYMWNFIDEVCVEIGPRPSASVAEKKAGDRIEKELRALCDETYQEEFTLAPKAFLGFVRYSAIMILCSVLFYWLSILVDSGALLLVSNSSFIFLIIGLILVSVSFFYFVFEVMLQQEVIDFLYSKKKANNVIGIINSKAEKEQELIFGAHIDSAYEYKPFYYLKTFGGASILIGLISVICIFVFFWFKLIFYFIQIEITPLFIAFGIIMLISIPFGFIFIFFLGKNAVQGAYDNLSGVAILLGIAKYISPYNSHDLSLNHTKIQLVFFACEEAACRGSKNYVDVHYRDLNAKNTKFINIDSIAKKDKLVVVNREILRFAKLDGTLSQELFDIAKNLKFGIKFGPLLFGASDAVAFSKKKIPATSIMNFDLPKMPPYYHTRKDTPKVVDKEALAQVLEICIEYIKKYENEKELDVNLNKKAF